MRLARATLTLLPVYVRQTASDLTGEHTSVMIRPLENSGDRSWLGAFSRDFQKRFLTLLSYSFRDFPAIFALSIDEAAVLGSKLDAQEAVPLSKTDLDKLMTPFDLKRLESYANNMLDYRVVLDLIPIISSLYFTGRLKSNIKLSGVQQAILLAVGEQRKDMDTIGQELSLPSPQLLAMFIKILRKVTAHFGGLVNAAADAEMPRGDALGVSRENATGTHEDEQVDGKFVPLEGTLEDELEEGGDEALREVRKKQRELIDALPLDQYEIDGGQDAWDDAEKQVKSGGGANASTTISVKSGKAKRKAGPTAAEVYEEAAGDKSRKKAKKGKKA